MAVCNGPASQFWLARSELAYVLFLKKITIKDPDLTKPCRIFPFFILMF